MIKIHYSIRFCLTLIFLFFASLPLFGQQTISQDVLTGDDLLYRKEISGGGLIHTNGWGLAFRQSKINSIFKKTFKEYSFTVLKHPREVRQQSPFTSANGGTGGYIFGKINNFVGLSVSFGRAKVLASKARRHGIEVSLLYAGGPSLGITKPYYLEIIENFVEDRIITRNVKYTPETAQYYTSSKDRIFCASGLFYGLTELRFHPGATGKMAVLFDWGKTHKTIKALEAGVSVQVHAALTRDKGQENSKLKIGAPPIMATNDDLSLKNKYLFTSLYLQLMLGARK